MRCAECDQILVPQVVGRSRDGRLTFGLCAACVERAGGQVLGTGPVGGRKRWGRARLSPLLQGAPRRDPEPAVERPGTSSRRRRASNVGEARRPLLLGLAGAMLAWALTLGFLSVIALRMEEAGASVPGMAGAPGVAPLAALMMAMVGMTLWLVALEPSRRVRVALQVIQVLASLGAFLVLLWGIIAHDPRRDPWVVVTVLIALGTAALARRVARRPAVARSRSSMKSS